MGLEVDSPNSDTSREGTKNGVSRLFKFFGILLLGIFILFLTDSLEIKANNDEFKAGIVIKRTNMTEMTGSVGKKTVSNLIKSLSNATNGGGGGGSTKKQTSKTGGTTEPAARYTYQRRGQAIEDSDKTSMIEKWGSWTLDNDAIRSKGPSANTDYYKEYPNRDVPFAQIPKNAWQKNPVYVQEFLQQGLELIERARESILAEYGHGKDEKPNESFAIRSDMFTVQNIEDAELPDANIKAGNEGGWMTSRSKLGLQRRLLHAIMTEDTFVFAMGGHSAAAGHGNHFSQSYTLQVAWIMEPIFARLGVKHESRNFGNGGLGTLHNGMGLASIYGPDIDMLMWDSGMTEHHSDEGAVDIFARQGLIGGHKVPFLYSLPSSLLKNFHQHADVDVGHIGEAMSGIPLVEDFEKLEDAPWATRYMNCGNEIKTEYCKPNFFNSVCWIDRDDFTPKLKQLATPGGQASWHPGFRFHQLKGRIIAFTLLTALHDALTMWSQQEGQVLPDEAWHLTDYYDNIRTKVSELDPALTGCAKYLEERGMEGFLCKYPFKARTEFTPRFNPAQSIRSLMTPDTLEHINAPPKVAYDPPDVNIPGMHPPPGEIDVLNIVEAGLSYGTILDPSLNYHIGHFDMPPPESMSKSLELPPGKGVSLNTVAGDQFCGGTLGTWCARSDDSTCLLIEHNDFRNRIEFDGYSGWIKMVIPKVKHGYIVLRLETWGRSNANPATKDFTTVDNVGSGGDSGGGQDDSQQRVRRRRRRVAAVVAVNWTVPQTIGLMAPIHDDGNGLYDSVHPSQTHRDLKEPVPAYCDDFRFEYALDGTITSMDLEAFKSKKSQLQRVVEAVTILANKDYLQGKDEADIELAIRIVGCGRIKTFHLSHVYWA